MCFFIPACFFIFFYDPATTEIYTLSLHDALPISHLGRDPAADRVADHQHVTQVEGIEQVEIGDRKSTRLNSSHLGISYAVFCLKKKKLRRMLSFVSNRHRLMTSSGVSCRHALMCS